VKRTPNILQIFPPNLSNRKKNTRLYWLRNIRVDRNTGLLVPPVGSMMYSIQKFPSLLKLVIIFLYVLTWPRRDGGFILVCLRCSAVGTCRWIGFHILWLGYVSLTRLFERNSCRSWDMGMAWQPNESVYDVSDRDCDWNFEDIDRIWRVGLGCWRQHRRFPDAS